MIRIILIALVLAGFSSIGQIPKRKLLKTQAPEEFLVEFETTRGNFTIKARRSWSPKGVDRLYQLVISGFYTDIAIFRVQADYVVQFGISSNSNVNKAWEHYELEDEPVVLGNGKGTVSFARGGPNTRTTQLFINVNENPKLDTMAFNGVVGFPCIAEVVDGMDVVQSFYGAYGFDPAEDQDSIYSIGNSFLERKYPKLDYISLARVKE